MDNQNIVLIYNLLKGSNDRLSFQKLRYAYAMLKHEEFVEGLKQFDTLEEILEYANSKKENCLSDVNLRDIKVEITHDLLEGMLHGYFDVDTISVDAYYHPELEDMPEVVKLGKIIVHHKEEDLQDLFPPIPLTEIKF